MLFLIIVHDGKLIHDMQRRSLKMRGDNLNHNATRGIIAQVHFKCGIHLCQLTIFSFPA